MKSKVVPENSRSRSETHGRSRPETHGRSRPENHGRGVYNRGAQPSKPSDQLNTANRHSVWLNEQELMITTYVYKRDEEKFADEVKNSL